MGIISVVPVQPGLVGVKPSLAYIETSDTIAEVTTTGYLNKQIENGTQFTMPCIAAVSTQASPGAALEVGWYQVTHSGANWSLTLASNDDIALASGHILVGNPSNLAADVAMSGDATIDNTGALTIANLAVSAAKLAANAVTTAKILDANVTLAKLAAGITPSHIIKFAGTEANGGGSATIPITVTGALGTDLPFVQIQASTNAVTVQKVTPTANTVTVLLSGDPGAGTTLSYQVLRAAS